MSPDDPASGQCCASAAPGDGAPESQRPAYRYRTSSACTVHPALPLSQTPSLQTAAAALWLLAGFLLLYRADLGRLADRWVSDAGWSHGLLVPFIALFLVRLKWPLLQQLEVRGSWAGFPILAAGVVGQVFFRATGLAAMSPPSMLVTLLGAALFLLGWEHLKLLWLPILYLAFAVPPPGPLYVALTTPMQGIAAECGVQLLPLLGCTAARHGTIIEVAGGGRFLSLEVAQACSGMRMLIAFVALAAALAYSTDRRMWQKVLLTALALPIAILCNALRVAATGALAVHGAPDWSRGDAHEYLGIAMLAPALLLQSACAWALDRLLVEVPAQPSGGPAPRAEGGLSDA
jgi:exosortase